MALVDTSEFEPRTIDKVERLLDLLEEMERHLSLKGKLALHGGTAINLFMLDVPRLSVDIGVSYIGAIAREDMLAERPQIETGIEAVARAQGYTLEPSEGGHAGKTFLLRYRGDWGTDHVKIDCIYMNRSPVLPPLMRETPLRPRTHVRTFTDMELAGGKTKAFFDRVKVRDLFDIANLNSLCNEASDENSALFHKLLLYYASLSACFPNEFVGRSKRFAQRQSELEDQLHPMLKRTTPKPTLENLMDDAESFIANWILPKTDGEREYVERFGFAEYQPELLFDDAAMAKASKINPEALWKLRNLKKMRG